MFIFHNFMVLLLIAVTHSYRLQCPVISQRPLRASTHCIKSLRSEYTCLYDTNRLLFFEQCIKDPDYATPGEHYVISGSFRNVDCSSERYQPFPLWSNVSGECLYQKSLCKGAGQLIYNNGSIIEDITCRCDYTKGYQFIQRPKQNCFCIPSEEDCSCYIRKCDDGFMLSSDYVCIREDERDGFKCPPIMPMKNTSGSMQSPNIKRDMDKRESKQLSRSYSAIIMVISLISVFACIPVLRYTVNKLIHLKNKIRETRLNHENEAKALKKILLPTLPGVLKKTCDINLSKLKKELQKIVISGDRKMLMMMLNLESTEQCVIVMKILFKEFKIEKYSSHIEKDQNAVLMVACMTGDWNTVKLFLKNINVQNKRGETPLIIACKFANIELIKELIRAKADVNIFDENRRSPLHFACSAMHVSYSFKNIKIQDDKMDYELEQKELSCSKICNDVIQLLIQHTANVKLSDNKGVTPLMLACQAKCVKSVDILLENGASTKAVDKIGYSTALFWALQEKYEINMAKIVKLLIDNGADVNYTNNQDDTPFIMACKVDHIDIIEQLINAGIDVMSTYNRSLLFQACSVLHFKSVCSKKCTTIIDLIIQKYGEKYVDNGNIHGDTPLMLASKKNCLEAVELLLKHGAKPNVRDKDNSTALFWVIRGESGDDDTKLIEILLKKSAAVDLLNNIGLTPIMLACELGKRNIARILNDNVQNKNEQNKPLIDAFQISFSFLLENAEDISVAIKSFTKLSIEDMITVVADLVKYRRKELLCKEKNAAESTFLKGFEIGNLNILRFLIECNVDLNKRNRINETPLMKACEIGDSCIDIVKMLVSKTDDINASDDKGRTALFVTCSKENPSYETVKSLFKRDSHDLPNCTIVDNNGISPLMALCSHDSNDYIDNIIEIIDFLITNLPADSSINQKSPNNQTYLSFACQNGHPEIVKKLLNKGALTNEECINVAKKRGDTFILNLLRSSSN